MSVQRIDTARTTSLPVMDAADAIAMWGEQLQVDEAPALQHWGEPTPRAEAPPAPLKPGQRISVYWTDMRQWYNGTYTSSRVEQGDDGAPQRASRVVYDADGPWAQCPEAQLAYWHCLDDETYCVQEEPATPARRP